MVDTIVATTMVQPPPPTLDNEKMEEECSPLETPQLPATGVVKRKRRNMFDVRPEDLGIEVKVEPISDQLTDDGKGELLVGAGSGGFQYRFSEAKKALPNLIREQEEKLAHAKRYAMEQSVQHVLNKQKVF